MAGRFDVFYFVVDEMDSSELLNRLLMEVLWPALEALFSPSAAPESPRGRRRERARLRDDPPSEDGSRSQATVALLRTQRRGERAEAPVRDQLAHGPKPASQIEAADEAAEIPECSLIAAADSLGVRTRRGHWWLPG